MEDDTLYFPGNDFEWEMKEEKGFPYFIRYRKQLEVEKKQEKDLIERYAAR